MREVQRILLELLNQMDGFDQTDTVKVIMATNRADTLDPALMRPGRLDRKIEFPHPDRRQKRLIFQVMQISSDFRNSVYFTNRAPKNLTDFHFAHYICLVSSLNCFSNAK